MRLESSLHIPHKQRKHSSLLHSNKGRQSTTALDTTKSKIPLPVETSEETLQDIFKPLISYMNTKTAAEKDVEGIRRYFSEQASTSDEAEIPVDDRLEEGAKLQVKFTEEDLGISSPWKSGWYTAEVQKYDYNTDVATIVYISQPHLTYVINVSELKSSGKLRDIPEDNSDTES